MANTPMTPQAMVDISRAAVETYRQLREEEGLNHVEALEVVLDEAEEGAACALGECGGH